MLRGSRASSKGYAPLSMTNRMTAEDHRSAAGPLYFAASRLLVSTCGAMRGQYDLAALADSPRTMHVGVLQSLPGHAL